MTKKRVVTLALVSIEPDPVDYKPNRCVFAPVGHVVVQVPVSEEYVIQVDNEGYEFVLTPDGIAQVAATLGTAFYKAHYDQVIERQRYSTAVVKKSQGR